MIEADVKPLPTDRAKQLRDWLKRPEYETLKLVVDGQVKFHQAKASAILVLSRDENSRKLSDGKYEDAQRYQNCLEVLEEILAPGNDLTTVKLI